MQTPGYNGFYIDIRVVGCVAEESPLRLVNGRYRMDFVAIRVTGGLAPPVSVDLLSCTSVWVDDVR